MLRPTAFISIFVLLVASGACGAGSVRPTFPPFPEALVDTIAAAPDSLVEQLSEILRADGIELRWVRVREGYVETEWFDSATGRTGGGQSLNTEGIIRLRFWTDWATEHESVVVGEAVRRRIVDPSLPVRETEVHVAGEHRGYEILHHVMELLTSGSHGHEH